MRNALHAVVRGLAAPLQMVAAMASAPVSLPNRVLVGTHHKTGTVWMIATFRMICREMRLRFAHGHGASCNNACDVYVSYDSQCDWQDEVRPWKGLHLIRDPRDVIVSAAFYHATSRELWLHVKKPEFGGLTYSEKINSYATLDDRIAFEMDHASRRTVEAIGSWDYANPRFLEVRYEALVADEDLRMFHDIFTFLGFPGRAIPGCLRAAYSNSLFSGSVKKGGHVRSGKSQQWRQHLGPHHRKQFLSLFGDVLIRLGYEADNSWVEAVEASPPATV